MNSSPNSSQPANAATPVWQRSLPYLLFTLLALLYLIVIPTGESPDEPGHLRCIEQVSVQQRIPFVDPPPLRGSIWWHPEAILSGYVCYHTPLYYLLAGGTQRMITAVTSQSPTYQFPPHNYDFGPRPNLFEHDERKPNAWQITDPWHIVGLRLLSILLSGVMVWATIRITRYLVPEQAETAVIAGLLVAGWPQFVYFSRSINNDIMANALAVLVLVLLLRVGQPRRYILLSLLSALALLTKLTTAFALVVIGLVWCAEMWVYRDQIRPYLKNMAIGASIWAGTALLIRFHPTLYQNLTYNINYISWFRDDITSLTYWLEVANLSLSSGWVRFAWMNMPAPMSHAYAAWAIIGGLIIIGFGYGLQKLRHASAPTYLHILILLLWMAGNLASYTRMNMTLFQPQFRYLFMLLPIIMATAAIGLGQIASWLPARLRIYPIFLLISLTWLGYNAWVIITLIIPAYY